MIENTIFGVLIIAFIVTVVWVIWNTKKTEEILSTPIEPEDDDEEWYVPK
jgi:hypothetical protein